MSLKAGRANVHVFLTQLTETVGRHQKAVNELQFKIAYPILFWVAVT